MAGRNVKTKSSMPLEKSIERKNESFNEKTTRAEPRAPPPQFSLPLNVAFYLCLLSHVLAAAFAPIQDCDEVFNYWEPLHYLNHGYGLQTWEYSPEFAIRSWFYIVIHAIPAKLGHLLGRSKSFEFYFLRTMLAIVCAATETRLFSVISRTLNPRIGIIYLIIAAFSPGIFYASVAYLPSTFAMYTSNLGLAAFMDWRSGPKTAQGIMWFGIGAIVGWPFSGILVAPFVFEEIVICLFTGQGYDTFRRFLDGTVRSLIALTAVDIFFYHGFIVVPVRLVLYNVLSGGDRGPNIFGTEPWDFYSRNLLLNFNVWYLLAIGMGPMLFLQYAFRSQATTKQTLLRTVIMITPFYIWMTIFTLQPHKEERFMYPAYPFLALNAAIGFHMILTFLGSANPRELVGRIPVQLKLAVALLTVVLSINVGLLRTIGTVTAYRAPLQVYRALEAPGMARPGETVCLGKEWYRFPSSHFLPNGTRAKFIKSSFSGLLPGEFNEAKTGFGVFAGTWLVPAGMNDLNEEDPGKYVSSHVPATSLY
ncbi:hypothetical protein EPUS_00100 [Endocarpon pusillum Z07020]|uniref:Mannosyltransferase n=1 Tax=Endocarpon pusillum (strain Z07020 / HMAS-L-300199) TaxID=1263415 RepID=U1GSF0_ENDPU|nr:uncharacterized protein EPUS_00100 [Endocarpon pusillum Z07020]ERF75308.1 hypothetical protein EPUS_00100 [Endocarpon pusillum Z07020]